MSNDNKKRLYDALSSTYDLGTFEDFSKDIEDEGKRRKLYDATQEEYDFGAYEDFSSQLGYAPAPSAREQLQAFYQENRAFMDDFEQRDSLDVQDSAINAVANEGLSFFKTSRVSNEERQRYNQLSAQRKELEKAWYTSDEYLSQKNATALELGQMRDDIHNSKKAYVESQPQIKMSGLENAVMEGKTMGDYESQQFDIAARIMDKTIKLHNAPSKYDSNSGLKNMGIGAADKATDPALLSAGLTEITDNVGARVVLQKVQKELGNLNDLSEERIEKILSPAEKAVLRSWAMYAQEQLNRQGDLSLGYQAGQGAVESLAFMAEFALTGGVGKAASEGAETLAKWLGKKWYGGFKGLGDEAAEAVMKAAGEKTLGKYGQKLGLALAETAGRTLVMPSTYRNISEKATEIETDEEGNSYLVGLNDAFIKGYADSFIENLSEGGRVNALGDLVGDIAGNIPAWKKMVNAFSNTKASELLKRLNSTGIMNTLRAGGWHGFGEEYLEEWYGNALRTITGVDKNALKDFATLDNQMVTLASFLPITIFGGTVSTGQVISAKRDLDKKAEALQSALMSRGYDEAQAKNMIDMMRAETPQGISNLITPLIRRVAGANENEARELAKPAMEFAWAVQRYQSYDTKYSYQQQEQRDNLKADMETKLGKFWMEGEDGQQTVQRGVNEKGEVVYLLGKKDIEETAEGIGAEKEVAAIDAKGNHIFVFPSDYRLEEELPMNDFLGIEIMTQKRDSEAARMASESDAKFAEVKSRSRLGTQLNIGTNEAPVVATISKVDADGVVVETPEGFRKITYTELANKYADINPAVYTDAELDEQEADNISAERAQREAALDQEYENDDDAIEELAEAENEIEQSVEEATKLPLKDDGTVDQAALWNDSPARWAKWNDEQKQDGGADTLAYLNTAIKAQTAKIEQLVAAQDAETDFDRRDAIAAELSEARMRQGDLLALHGQYTAQVEAQAIQQQAAQPVQPAPQLTEEEKAALEEERRKPLRAKAKELSEKLGVKVKIAEDLSDVKESKAREQLLKSVVSNGKQKVAGWYNQATGEVTIFLPHAESVEDVEKTFIHEVVAHKGLRGLLGEEGFNVLCDAVWDMMSEGDKIRFINYPGVNGDKRAAADEYMAHFAENLNLEEAKPDMWERIVAIIKQILDSMGVRLRINQEGLSSVIAASYQKLLADAKAAQEITAEAVAETAAETIAEGQQPEAVEEGEERTPFRIVEEPEVDEESTSPFMAAAQQEGESIRFSITTEESLQEKIRNFAKTKEGKATKWSEDDIESIIAETESLIDAIHKSSTGNEFYDEFAYKEPTIRVDWRDGEAKPIVTWTRANIEYKYDMSADLLCINNESLEQVLSSDKMVALMEMFIPEKKAKKGEPEIKFTSEDYLELYNTLKDLGFVVPCKGCFDAAGRFKMLPSVAQKFAAEVNAVIDERNKDPKAFDDKLKAKSGEKTIDGLPTTASTKSAAIAVGVAGDNLTEHVKWTQLMSADGQTKMLSDWGGIFRAWQRTGAGRPKDKLLPEPYYGDIVSSVSTIIGKYGEKTPSFRDVLVNQGTGLRRNSHSEFRPVLAIDEIQFMRDAFIRNLTVFKYMKELDDVRLFGKMGVKFNMSFFPEYVPGTKVAGLDKDGNYIASEESVGSREFPYQGEDGKRHYDGMKGWAEAQKYINKDVSLSSVIFSIPHLLKALTDVPTPSDMRGIWGSLIPFHSSGATTASLAMQGLGMARANGVGHGFIEAFSDYGKGVTNFEAVQNDRFGEGWYIVSGKKAGENVEPGHKLEFANGNHYYNQALGVHLFASGYILDSELPEGALAENGELNITDQQKKALMHNFTIDYNDKVRELKGPYAYKDAADYYISELPKLGLIPRFDFEVSEEKFLEMCEAANVDPRHPKLGWKGEGNSWSPIDSEAYYSLFCDYGMTDPTTGEWAPHMPVGYVNEEGKREFRLPENAVEIVKEGLGRFSEVRRSENARIDEAIEKFAERSVEKGRISQKSVDKVLGKKSAPKKSSKSNQSRAIDLVEEAKKAVENTSDIRFSIIGEMGAMRDKSDEGLARLNNLEVARQMESELNPDWSAKNDENALKIKVATGWERGADGKWRYEVDDIVIKHEKEWMDSKKKLTLRDIVEPNPIFNMYPDLLDIKIVKDRSKYSLGASYNHKKNEMKLPFGALKDDADFARDYGFSPRENKSFLRTLEKMAMNILHEVQHAIQDREGFAAGGNSNMLLPKDREQYASLVREYNALAEEYNEILNKEGYSQAAKEKGAQADKKSSEADQFLKTHRIGESGYKRLAGEVEANNVEKRSKLSDYERYNSLLASTEDVARKDQIFLMDAVAGDVQNNVSFHITRTEEQREKLFADAKERFGVTNNFKVAGYMLPDGSLLDFSEANDGGDPNVRSLDHRSIEDVIMEDGTEYESRWMYLADFMNEGAIRLLPEYAGINLMKAPTKEQRQKLMDFIYKYNGEVILEIADERLNNAAYVEYDRRTSPSRIFRDIDGYFNEGIVPQQDIRFRMSNDNQAIFVSNAAKAVEGIKMEKATPEQWLKMIEKNGGLKAGEDKWMGLSDWLKASDKKTLTKEEVLDFVNEHMIQIEEQHYGINAEDDAERAHGEISERLQDKFDNYVDEYYQDHDWEDGETDNAREYAIERLREEMGDTFPYTIELEYGSVYLTFPYEEEDDLVKWAEKTGVEYTPGVAPINDTRLNYTTDGLDNKHEIALTVPTIESWNESDDIHFGDAGDGRAVAWIRFGDTEVTVERSENTLELQNQYDKAAERFEKASTENFNLSKESNKAWEESGEFSWTDSRMPEEWQERKREVVAELREARMELDRLAMALRKKEGDVVKKVLVIDEIQSKRHQEGREKGYQRGPKVSLTELRQKAQDFEQKMIDKYHPSDLGIVPFASAMRGLWTLDEIAEYNEMISALGRGVIKNSGIPDAPFDKNWHELAMKRMLRYAAENGYDAIAWTKGEQQAERYNIGSYVSSIEMQEEYDGNRDFGFYMGDSDEATTVTVDENGIVVSAEGHLSQAEGRPLADLVGKDMAVKMMQMEEYDVLEDTDLKVGNEGMKGFYDRMLPAFMNKYGKKWGVKVSDIELPNVEESGRIMHSVPVTEEMKASVMEGQVMFRISESKGANESIPNYEFESDIRFRLSKNNRELIGKWLNKRGDLTEQAKEETLDLLDQFDDATLQLSMGKWFAQNAIRLPDDVEKCMQAVASAKKAKVDPMKFAAPMEIIDQYGVTKPKDKPINPDKVSTLSKVRELPNGLAIYDVEESEESRKNMREIINTHFGKESSPWCLLQGNDKGELTQQSAEYWNKYNAYPKQVVFKDGKLLAFCANDTEERRWWDRMDKSYAGIPVNEKLPNDRLGRSRVVEYNEETGKQAKVNDIKKFVTKDGMRSEWTWRTPKENDIKEYRKVKTDTEEMVEGFDKSSWNIPSFLQKMLPKESVRFVRSAGVEMTFDAWGKILNYWDENTSIVYDGNETAIYTNDERYLYRNGKLVDVIDANNITYTGAETQRFSAIAKERLTQAKDIQKNAKSIAKQMVADLQGESLRFRVRGENESAMDFTKKEVENFTKRFYDVAPIYVVDKFSSKAELAKALEMDEQYITDEQYQAILDGYNGNGKAFYSADWSLIITFAKSDNSDDIEHNLFHESVHKVDIEDIPDGGKLGQWFWDNADSIQDASKIKDAIENAPEYSEEDYAREMLAELLAWYMSIGETEILINQLPSEYQKTVKSILSEIRYDSREEDNLRQQPETTYSRAKDAIRKGTKEYGGKRENAKSNELSAEERRIIGEYFPEFNKSEEEVMKAPNGKDSKLTKDQWNLVRSEEFIDWFGDWINDPENASKVVDPETGEPMVVYHGTAGIINEFQDQQRSPGFWFVDREDVANGYAESASAEFGEEKNIIPVFLNIRNPRIEDANAEYPAEFALKSYVENDNGVYEEFDTYEQAEAYRKENVPDGWVGASKVGDQHDLVEWARERGNDGVIIKNVYDQAANAETGVSGTQTNYVVLRGNQIKLTSNENPSESSDIRFRTSLELDKEFGDAWRNQQNEDGRHSTQVANTKSTYEKIGHYLEDAGMKGASILDASSGLGLGTKALREMGFQVDDVEPFPSENREAPTFSSYADIDGKYDVVISNAVLNVIPDDWRADVLHQMANAVKEGGKMIINTRPASNIAQQGVEGKTRITLDSPSEILVKRGDRIAAYQKGFTSEELAEWIKSELGEGWRVEKATKKNSGISGEGTAVVIKDGDNVSFRTTGTPTDEVVAKGVDLTPSQTSEVAANIFAALPEESRKKITDGLNGNILGLKDAILQIPASLASKENWNDEDRAMADIVAEEMTKMAGEMTRPFSAPEALWLLYNNLNKSTDLVSLAQRSLVQRNLGFDAQTLATENEAKESLRFRQVGDAMINATAGLYNKGAVNVMTRLKESFVDMNASVEELVKAIEERTGKKAEGFENILWALNQQSSRGLAAMEDYERRFLNPMYDAILNIMDKAYAGYATVVRHVILKHGLERNKKLAQRDAKAHYQEIYEEMIAKVNSMDDRQKRTHLTNAQLQDADAKAKLATLKAADTSAFTEEEKNAHKRELAKAKEEVKKAKENLERAQKINSMSEQELKDELDMVFEKIENGTDSVYKELRKNDYSGISSMFYDQLGVNRKDYSTEEEYQAALMLAKNDRFSSLEEVEVQAEGEVESFEGRVDTKELWKRVNAATKETLRQQYEANMISKDQYESLRDMFEYYVPLRGFKDNTAEDMYTYYRKPNSTGYTKPILGAEGRKTEAESPFGWIASMAGSAIASNVKNEAKLALFYFVSNRQNNGVATISKTWYVHTPGDVDERGKKIFKPVYPPFSEDLSSDAAKAQYEQWQDDMRKLKEQGLAYEAGQRLNLGNAVVNISDANKPEHIVAVKVGGKEYTIVINGNPRAAQAINGELNLEGTADDYSALFGPVLRWMSSVNTSYNPEFWITNMMRDMAFTWMAVNTKEADDKEYRRKFSKNYRKAFKVISLVNKNEKGTLGNSPIEQAYKDFVENGGVTGYTQIKDNETWEKEIDQYLRSNSPESLKSGKMMRGMKTVFHAAHRFGESLEQVSRFAAFLTARETGKSINEAINDAKEITVNFNRKGSGKMISLEEAKHLTDKNGRPLSKPKQWMVVGLSSIAPLGRRFIMFFNAAIQGLNATYKLWKANPKRFKGWVMGYFAVGAMNAILHAMMDDDDDYLDMPQYERRNALMIGGNGAYLKWALPQEARAFYALGDIVVESMLGRNPQKFWQKGGEVGQILTTVGEVLPINPTEGWRAVAPSIAIPALELMINEDYKGEAIYNDSKWLSKEEASRTANWNTAKSGTGWVHVKIAQGLNFLTGGDKYDAGLINIRPEAIEHIVQSAFGGTIRTADKFITTISAAIDPEEDVTVSQTPFLNRVLTLNDQRYRNVHVNEVFDYYAAEAEHAKTLEKKYRKDGDSDALLDLTSSDEYQWMMIYENYKKPLENVRERLKVADGTRERKQIMREQDELKKMMIKQISDL